MVEMVDGSNAVDGGDAVVRIVHVRSAEFYGGPERAILGQCTNVPGADFAVISFVRRGNETPFLDRAEAANVPAMAVEERHWGDAGMVRRLRSALRELDADIVVSHDYKSNLFSRLAARRLPTRHVCHFRGRTNESRRVVVYNQIDTMLLRRSPAILTVSGGSRDYLVRSGVSPRAIRVVPNAIESEKLAAPDLQRTRDPGRPFRFIALGRLSPEKGIDVLIDASARLKNQGADFELRLYGHGPQEAALRARAAAAGLSDHIMFCGFVERVLPVLDAADCLVLPSRSEGMPNALLEAWARKLPVVATAVGGVPEMVVDGKTGLLVPSEDPEALAARMQHVLEAPVEAALLGSRGYARVMSSHSYAAQAQLLHAAYRDVLLHGGFASAASSRRRGETRSVLPWTVTSTGEGEEAGGRSTPAPTLWRHHDPVDRL